MPCILRRRNPEAFGGVCGAQTCPFGRPGGHVWFEDTSWMSQEVSRRLVSGL